MYEPFYQTFAKIHALVLLSVKSIFSESKDVGYRTKMAQDVYLNNQTNFNQNNKKKHEFNTKFR